MEELTLLGSGHTDYPTKPEDAKLELIPNEWAHPFKVQLECPEFTSLCPKTGQPDFAQILIEYEPDRWLIESKALKLYLFSFRNTGMFHEFVVNRIARDLYERMEPNWIEVQGMFYPRGGISINPKVRLEK